MSLNRIHRMKVELPHPGSLLQRYTFAHLRETHHFLLAHHSYYGSVLCGRRASYGAELHSKILSFRLAAILTYYIRLVPIMSMFSGQVQEGRSESDHAGVCLGPSRVDQGRQWFSRFRPGIQSTRRSRESGQHFG